MPYFKKISTKTDIKCIFEKLHTSNQNIITKKRKKISESFFNDVWVKYRFTQSEKEDLAEKVRKYISPLSIETICTTNEPTDKIIKKNQLDVDRTGQTRFSLRLATKKRKIDSACDKQYINKYVKQNYLNFTIDNILCWVSATKTKNYLLGDQCVDWLAVYYEKFGITSHNLEPSEQVIAKSLIKDASHLNVLLEGGNTFENKIYAELRLIYKNDFVIVWSESDMNTYRSQISINGIIREGYEKVKSLMQRGVPIIAQAPLINDNNQSYGVADILIRSDYLSTLFKTFVPDADIYFKAPFLDTGDNNYHYRVIDCKWATITLCVDGLTIRNDAYIPAYKGQLAVYTACLESLQGYVPTKAYIMAKAWKIDKANIPDCQVELYRGYSAFDRPGVIDYQGKDYNYLEKTKNAIKWIQQVMTLGREWRYHQDKPSVPDMYPNMTKTFNPMYDKIKSIIAKRYKDPTMVWYVGTDHRKIAHDNGVMGTDNEKCTASLMRINNARGKIIDSILDINRVSQQDDIIRPLCIKNNMGDWQNNQSLDYYVDFETINYNIYIHPEDMDIDNSYIDSDVTFMIGVGFEHDPLINTVDLIKSLGIDSSKYNYVHNHDMVNGWEYVCFYLVQFKIQNEMEIFRLFFDFIVAKNEIHNIINKNDEKLKDSIISRIFHWTGAEVRFINRAINRILSGKYVQDREQNNSHSTNKNGNKNLSDLVSMFERTTKWIDMYKVFESEPIVIKGSYRFKLKHIGNAFYSHGLIDTVWKDGKMSDGFRAMLEAIELYRANQTITHSHPMYKEIVDYNEVDCRVIWEIVNYLRDNHCVPLENYTLM